MGFTRATQGPVSLFCVGDDAQSIYGFRGADLQNIHHFKERVPNAAIFKMEKNYRSTQEILDLSNWLLDESEIKYDKRLEAYRGKALQPNMHIFPNEFDEAKWIAIDLRRASLSTRQQMVQSIWSWYAPALPHGVLKSSLYRC